MEVEKGGEEQSWAVAMSGCREGETGPDDKLSWNGTWEGVKSYICGDVRLHAHVRTSSTCINSHTHAQTLGHAPITLQHQHLSRSEAAKRLHIGPKALKWPKSQSPLKVRQSCEANMNMTSAERHSDALVCPTSEQLIIVGLKKMLSDLQVLPLFS